MLVLASLDLAYKVVVEETIPLEHLCMAYWRAFSSDSLPALVAKPVRHSMAHQRCHSIVKSSRVSNAPGWRLSITQTKTLLYWDSHHSVARSVFVYVCSLYMCVCSLYVQSLWHQTVRPALYAALFEAEMAVWRSLDWYIPMYDIEVPVRAYLEALGVDDSTADNLQEQITYSLGAL